jgi:1,4-alpha-glucan branching enzyme
MSRMPGDEWRRFANLRLMYSLMYTHPGTKLLFMGSEFGQTSEWKHDGSLDWHLLQHDFHKGVLALIKDLNTMYRKEQALYLHQFSGKGFEWVDYADRDNSVIVFMRKSDDPEQSLMVVANFTPEVRQDYRMGVPHEGGWIEIFNSDNQKYGGSGQLNGTQVTSPIPYHGRNCSVSFTLPPLSISVFKLDKALAGFDVE